ncbi:GAF domain-containing protein [Archangium lipolyticum]|uniref:GAF domain-containing protein n=1 Tax=Archangium lipolyticum TaxID=2970465 RepID=UPI002149DE5A|nr:GAF domain-containing protein [Archangium lipolyticum]
MAIRRLLGELVEAERARVRGDRWQAVELYQAAIEGAREQGFIREEAVANERIGLFWETQHKPEYARMHLKRARQLYDAWGAQGKVAALAKHISRTEFPEPPVGSSSDLGSGQSSTVPTFNLDLLSIIRAARAISSELVQAELLHTMLRIIQENAGAQYAALVDFQEGVGWLIRGQTQMEQRAPEELPESVLNYVRRTLKPVVIDDASIQSPYADDAVVRSRGLHSVLCLPLIHRERQHGILYLENSLSTHAFSEARQDIVEILASQAAVALDNAALYHHLTERNRALETSRSAISAKNAIGEMPPEANPCTRISIRQDENHTTVAVVDNGVGFDEGLKEKLFASGFTTREGGHGYGLHSAAVSVQSLGGKIEAHSDGPGHGARFQFVLPRNRNAAASKAHRSQGGHE